MICHGRSGETSRISSVPRSFSRDSEIAVICADTKVSTNAMRPGTKRFTLSSVGLNNIRTRGSINTLGATAVRALPVIASVIRSRCQPLITALA
jgi:hypothetical protein